ncbi:MAG: radical SAM protein [Clostridia bacterium]|nr:radical SAM protein [Clostridia bacterium]
MKCTLCPVSCGADRPLNRGACSVGGLKIAKYYLHPFEEPLVSFSKGSGCIFFCGCSLKCVFCQNYELSRNTRGKEITVNELADIFKRLEDEGADNINLVNPTHYVREIAEAFEIYRPAIPVVYNTHGYEKTETLKLAESFTDIWLPDLKFMSKEGAARYSARADYPDYAIPAIKYMATKPLSFDKNGKMLSGCIVRHLILPLNAGEAVKAVNFVASLNKDVYFSLMSQYTPYGDVENIPELKRRITKREYLRALDAVEAAGLKNVFLQDFSSADEQFIPEWDY